MNVTEKRRTMQIRDDGPLLLAMLLGNQNNNSGANGGNNRQNNDNPSPDSLQIPLSSTVLEFKPDHETLSSSRQASWADSRAAYVLKAVGFDAEQERTKDIHHTAGTYNEEDITNILSFEELKFWKRNGYLVIKDALSPEQLNLLQTSVMDVVDRLSNDKDVARRQHRIPTVNYNDDEMFSINCNGRIVATLHNDARDKTLDPLQRIRRMGTGIHRLLPAFRAMTFSRPNQKIASMLGFQDPRIVQSMVITKPRGVGAAVIPHQDGQSSFTDPPSSVTFWYALQDATVENGCLKVVPGSHQTEPLTVRTRRGRHGCPEMIDLPKPVYAKDIEMEPSLTKSETLSALSDDNKDKEFSYKPIEVKAGTLILMHGNLVHASEANHSDNNRLAYNFSVVEGNLPWPEDAYLQPYEGHSEFEKLEWKTSSFQ